LPAARHAPIGTPRTQPFGERHHVRQDAAMLIREPLTGASDAALHLVQHQQPVLFVADLAQLPQIIDVQRADTAFALYRFDEYGYHAAIVLGNLTDRLQVVVRHAHETADQRLETCLHLAVAGGGKGRQRAPVDMLFPSR